MLGRRLFLGGGTALLAGCAVRQPLSSATGQSFEAIRATLGAEGRLGVAALNLATGRSTEFDAHSRYAMCSTFKVPLAAAILEKVKRSAFSLEEMVRFDETDLEEYAPVVRENLARGALSIAELCAAIIEVSDNAAANLLLPRVGGPQGLTQFMRRAGDPVSRLDRDEPELNTNLPGDPRDTTTPAAMLRLMRNLLTGKVLRASSRNHLAQWMVNATTGRDRLRAGLPAGWQVGDKTGTGAKGAANDIAIAWPPGGGVILISSYISGGDAPAAIRNAAHASVARLVASALG